MHETICGSQIKYQLAFEMENIKDLTICFHHIYPGYSALKRVYYKCLES